MENIDDILKDYLKTNAPEVEGAPKAWVEQAKAIAPKKDMLLCPHCGKGVAKRPLLAKKIMNGVWLALAVASFGASFYFKTRLFQWLALALFFGFKWVIDQRSLKTQILITKALQDSDESSHSRLHRHSSHL